MKKFTHIASQHIVYSLGTLIIFGAAPMLVRLVFAGFLTGVVVKSWTILVLVLTLMGAAEGLSIAMAQSRFAPWSNFHFPLKRWYWTMAIGSICAWTLVLGPTISVISALSSFNLIGNLSVIVLILMAGALFGSVNGIAQYFVYRRVYANSEILIIVKAVEWTCLTVVSVASLELLQISGTPLASLFVIANACLLSGAIQILSRNISIDILAAK